MTRTVLTVAALVLSVSALAQAPGELGYTDVPEMPGGLEGERIQLMFDAIHSGDEALAKRFYDEAFSDGVKEQFPFGAYMQFFGEFARTKSEIKFHSVREYDPPREDMTVIVFSDPVLETWEAFVFQYAEGEKPDGKLAGFAVNRARTPSDVEPEGPLTEEEAVAELEAFLDRLCDADRFSGTVLLAKGDEVLLAGNCGEASKRFHVPVNMETKFNLGSMNKMFTAVACMQLVEQGVVALDEPVGKWVDETWLPKEITDVVTLHHLLSHTSGLGDYFNETFEEGSRLRWREIDDYKELIWTDTLAFEPGTDWSYSNAGMFVAGVVIANASGEDYFDYIRDHVYAPAGMEDTDCYDMDCPVENLAIGYWPNDECAEGWKNNYYEHVVRGGPAGGGFSTAPDLYRFARALLDGKLVSQESLDLLWTDHFDPERAFGYGYGFGIRQTPNGKVVGHSGGFTGINANLDIYLDAGYIAAVMANIDMGAEPVRGKLEEVLGRVE